MRGAVTRMRRSASASEVCRSSESEAGSSEGAQMRRANITTILSKQRATHVTASSLHVYRLMADGRCCRQRRYRAATRAL
eukprot:321581-Prymnesium_polylepis.1